MSNPFEIFEEDGNAQEAYREAIIIPQADDADEAADARFEEIN